MDKFIYLILIPAAVYVMVRWLDKRYKINGSRTLLTAACVLFSASLFLPSPVIDGEGTEFFTHLIGGGVFTGLLWLYFTSKTKPRLWYVELLHLFVLVSVLGVLNELFELLTHVLGFNPKSIADTSWDLLANTLGTMVFYGCYRAIKYGKRLFLQR
jgi:hypothetical protein